MCGEKEEEGRKAEVKGEVRGDERERTMEDLICQGIACRQEGMGDCVCVSGCSVEAANARLGL